MKLRQENHEKLHKVMQEAYHDRDVPEPGAKWQQDVMRDIRRIGLPGNGVEVESGFGLAVWRLAPVTCVLILLAAGLMFSQDFVVDYELTTLLDDSIDSMYTQAITSL